MAPTSADVDLAKSLSWPVVAIVFATVVVFLALRAMRTEHSVDVRWRVTKSGEGRVVPRKITIRTPRRTA